MTEQEIIDEVCVKMMAQGRKANANAQGEPTLGCFYKDGMGRRCGVGCLLTDEEVQGLIDQGHNGRPVSQIPLPERLEPHRDLLQHIQAAHDNAWNGNFYSEFVRSLDIRLTRRGQ